MNFFLRLLLISSICFSNQLYSMDFIKDLWRNVCVVCQYIPILKNSVPRQSEDVSKVGIPKSDVSTRFSQSSGGDSYPSLITKRISSLLHFTGISQLFSYFRKSAHQEKPNKTSKQNPSSISTEDQNSKQLSYKQPSHTIPQKVSKPELSDGKSDGENNDLIDEKPSVNSKLCQSNQIESKQAKETQFVKDEKVEKPLEVKTADDQKNNLTQTKPSQVDHNNQADSTEYTPSINFDQLVKNSGDVPDLPIIALQGDQALYEPFKYNEDTIVYCKTQCCFGQEVLKEVFKKSGISAQDFASVCDKFINLHTTELLTNKDNWFDESYSQAELDGDELPTSYVMGVRIPTNTQGQKIILFPDLHGDWKTTMKFLSDKFDKDYCVKNKLEKIFFLGDIVDRGLAGAEALYTLLLLRLKNPYNLFIIRGNHEDMDVNNQYGFKWELQSKYGNDLFEKTLQSRIKKVYSLLPVMALVIHGKKGFVGCHGCVDYCYNAKQLVDTLCKSQSSGDVIYYQKYPTDKKIHSDNKNLENVFSQKLSNELYSGVGFMWLDHCNCQNLDVCKQGASKDTRLISKDRPLIHKSQIKALLDDWSTKDVVLRDVFRAHQHSSSIKKESSMNTNIMLPIFKGKGVYKALCDKNGTTCCHTALVAPNNTYGVATKNYPGFNYGTCIELVPDVNEQSGFKQEIIRKQGFPIKRENITFIKYNDEVTSTYVDENNKFYTPEDDIFKNNELKTITPSS